MNELDGAALTVSLPAPPITRTSPLWLLALASVLLGTVVVSGIVGLGAIEDLSYEFEVADRPATVDRTLETLLSAVQDIETGQRGFLLTGNEVYLEPYNDGMGKVDPLLDSLDRLVSWNPLQVERMPVLRSRVDSVQSYYTESVASRRERGLGVAVDRVQSGEGKLRTDSVRVLVARMQAEAVRVRGLREARVAQAQQSARRALWISSLTLLLALLLATAAVWRMLRSREAAAAKLAASVDQVRQSNESMSQALAEREQALHRVHSMQAQMVQQEKLAGLGRLTAGVAHELKNPLNFVTNFAQLSNEIADELADDLAEGEIERATESVEDLRANTRRVVEHAERADGIVRSMLTHARGVSGTREPVPLAPIIADSVVHGLGPEGADVEVTIEETAPVVVDGVALALSRLLQNLIANAVYEVRERAGLGGDGLAYTPQVWIRSRTESEYGIETAIIEIEDNGAGIPDADLPRIFEPFFTTKAPGQGTGLGLSLAHDIAVGHGGSLTAARSDGGGAVFTVRLPVETPDGLVAT